MQSALKPEQYLYEPRVSLVRRCYRVVINSPTKEEAKARAVQRGLPWLWCYTLAVQHGLDWVEE
ncbi:hypothetical protein ACHFJ9_12485 [Vibrio sp. D3]|uniref:hypothetical protein n=1 Tax=Vibrio sp. D3 TaxID=3374281 RepID=UPI0037571085